MAAQKRGGRQLVGTAEIARMTGMTEQWVRQLTRDGVIQAENEKGVRGRLYDQTPTLQKLMVYYWKKAERKNDPAAEKMAEEKLRTARAKTELLEMKVRRARGELHHTEDIKRIFGAMLGRLRTGLNSFPMGTAPNLLEKTDVMEVAGIMKTQLDKIMYEITEYDIDQLKSDVGVDYIAKLEAEDKNEKRRAYETGK